MFLLERAGRSATPWLAGSCAA